VLPREPVEPAQIVKPDDMIGVVVRKEHRVD
jgi:hypothetical protein